LNKITSWRSH